MSKGIRNTPYNKVYVNIAGCIEKVYSLVFQKNVMCSGTIRGWSPATSHTQSLAARPFGDMKHTLIIIWAMLLVSCGTKTHDTTTETNIDSAKTSLNEENFDDFFARFKADSLFQIERVKFPMIIKSWEIDEDKPTTDKIEIDSWRHLRFEYEAGYAKREIDAYTQETKMFADSAKLELRGVDNGILIDYDFIKLNGQWFLVSEKDYSN